MIAKRTPVSLLALGCALLLLVAHLAGGVAQSPVPLRFGKNGQQTALDQAFFDNEVLPVLKTNCFKCHADGKATVGFRSPIAWAC